MRTSNVGIGSKFALGQPVARLDELPLRAHLVVATRLPEGGDRVRRARARR
jgi:hypothetical protein